MNHQIQAGVIALTTAVLAACGNGDSDGGYAQLTDDPYSASSACVDQTQLTGTAIANPTAANTNSCGPANGGILKKFPAEITDMCSGGQLIPAFFGTFIPDDPFGNDGEYNWRCPGQDGSPESHCSAQSQFNPPAFVNFESGHVRPLALSRDGEFLFAVNTPDNRLTVYEATEDDLVLAAEIKVGLDPVSVALREEDDVMEAWVVNHVSDSVSIVSFDPENPAAAHVRRTLLVGDEPRDIVFAGDDSRRAFITTAHRGQNRPADPELTVAGTGRADVWVYDVENLGNDMGGTPISIVELLGDTPRALAVTDDGNTVYAAVFLSGNQTTTISQNIVANTLGLPAPPAGSTATLDPEQPPPGTGLIVRYNGQKWVDELGRDWSEHVPFSLPDYDVFALNANADPVDFAAQQTFSGVGTVLFNMAVNPVTDAVYVSNTEARNHVRFEPVLNGHNAESRITVLQGADVLPRHLNPHIDYSIPTGTQAERDATLASPVDMVVSSDGETLFVAALGSGKVAALSTAALEAGDIGARPEDRQLIEVGPGPSGLALDETRDRLYVLDRIDASIRVIQHPTGASPAVSRVPLPFNPEPSVVTQGRQFLYDALNTSGHGDNSCGTCHVFGDNDGLAWDLGNPNGSVLPNPNEFSNPVSFGAGTPFHPMKGPMTTQSLRGLAGQGPMHWRGDKTGGLTPEGELAIENAWSDEHAAFERFNSAFTDLQGRPEQLDADAMSKFADFALTLTYPPNPIKNLDNSMTDAEEKGFHMFTFNDATEGASSCGSNSCHGGAPGTSPIQGGKMAPSPQAGGEQIMFKIPHLRNLYTKVGMFGYAPGTLTSTGAEEDEVVGDQVRGFGYTHDGSVSTLNKFLAHPMNLLTEETNRSGESRIEKRKNLEQFLLRYDTGLRPAVGQQLTLVDSCSEEPVMKRVAVLVQSALRNDCDLVATFSVNATPKSALLRGDSFTVDSADEAPIPMNSLLGYASSERPVTLTCVPPGSGERIALDRDGDGSYDRDDSHPADAQRS